MPRDDAYFRLRLPDDLRGHLRAQAARYGGSITSEIIRTLREKQERTPTTAGESLPADPAAVSTNQG